MKYGKDKYHKIAQELIPQILETDEIFVTDYIINEVYAFLLRKTTYKIAEEKLDLFKNHPKIKILYNNELSFNETLPLVLKYNQLSIVDANIVYHSKKLKKPILTFEKYLNSIKDII